VHTILVLTVFVKISAQPCYCTPNCVLQNKFATGQNH